jgi:hypothetical protein
MSPLHQRGISPMDGRPASGSGLSLSILSWHTILSDPGEFDHRQFQRSDVDAAFAESRPARHSQDSRNPFHAGDDFRGFLVHTSATVCQLARPLHGSDRLPSQRGFYIRASSGLVALPAAGYNYNSDWTPLLAGLSPARMAASLAAPTPSSKWTFTTYSCQFPGALTHVTARRIAQPPKAAFVTRLQPCRLPGRTARQLPDQSTTLWVESSSTSDPCLRGALPTGDIARARNERWYGGRASAFELSKLSQPA